MIAGMNASAARAERSAKNAAIAMPTRLFRTNGGLERWARRTASITTAAPIPAMTARWTFSVRTNVPVNAITGTAASTMPRTPPSALLSWARTAASTVSCAEDPGPGRPGADPRASAPRASSARASSRTSSSRTSSACASSVRTPCGPPSSRSLTSHPRPPAAASRTAPQLVSRIEDDLAPVLDAHQPLGEEPAARRDAGDPAAAQPHEVDHVGAVVELGLQGGGAAPRTERHRTQRTRHLVPPPLGAVGDRRRALAAGAPLQLLGLEFGVAGR